ncbi:MAG: DNA mismatch repair protein MutS [Rhodobacteraceae bacterium]|nr:DNA mismatch repair protein MutS [Paracoccaceae bacterium]
MMAQYLEIKAAHPDALLFYRMGDFYEMFFDDAVAAAAALDIALTKRGKHLDRDIPMCGVPVHSAEGYLLALIRKGFRVAVCEQLENPAEAKKRGAKSVVKRDVVRLVTPGTLTEDSLLDARRHNYLAAWAEVRDQSALAWVDVSTGDFHVQPCPRVAIGPQLARLAPREVLLSPAQEDALRDLVEESGGAATLLARASFDSAGAERRLCALYRVKALDGFGQFNRAEMAAMGAIVDYLELTQKGQLPLLKPPLPEARERNMQIDAATRRNLELTAALSGGRDGSLLAAIDRTVTGAGARLLDRRLNAPSTDVALIAARLDCVGFLCDARALADRLREALRKVPDMDRALSRLALDRGGPRDLGAIRAGLAQAGDIAGLMAVAGLPGDLADAAKALTGFDAIRDLLERALAPELPVLVRDGGFVFKGFDADLDAARKLRDQGRGVIAGMQADYAALANVPSLKIKHNNVLGYFIETPSTHAERMLAAPLSETFIHRQTNANAVRFTTIDLSELETKILNAGGHALELEKAIFADLRAAVLEQAAIIAGAARALAEIDLAAALADLATAENWCRPVVRHDRSFAVAGGRHPVVEQALRRAGNAPFVANDCDLTPDSAKSARIWLLTGPNMAGKSTFLRQNALIALLAQIGSFVPADSAEIGIATQLFSRVGASDDLARGRSTFMVEMVETAAILNQAGPGALVILDEIGRGTATYDGLSIAWATLEHLHDVNRCRTLFATHYHELTALSSQLSGMENATVSVREWEGDVIFLHEVKKGAADRSYGVQVARLAGLPDAVVDRARAVLSALEKSEQEGGKARALIDDLPLFAVPQQPAAPVKHGKSELEAKLQSIMPDELTPIEALRLIYDLREMLEGGQPD